MKQEDLEFEVKVNKNMLRTLVTRHADLRDKLNLLSEFKDFLQDEKLMPFLLFLRGHRDIEKFMMTVEKTFKTIKEELPYIEDRVDHVNKQMLNIRKELKDIMRNEIRDILREEDLKITI